jgi:ABC-type branched-subunit amino acid transport system substrate-binding protein
MTILLEGPQIEVANGSLEGIIFVEYGDSSRDFVERYKARFSLPPDLGADTGYDTLYFYKRGIESARSSEPRLLQEALLKTEFKGASGEIRFDSKGGVIKQPIFKRLEGDRRVTIP